MDRYLFRGKRVDNGEWVEGWLFQNKHRVNKCFIRHFPDKDDYYEDCAVYKETIGQCTGLKDKNGKLIFEGDKLKDVKGRGAVVTVRFGTFNRKILNVLTGKLQDMSITGFYLEYNEMACLPIVENNISLLPTYEIIGNIHDKETI